MLSNISKLFFNHFWVRDSLLRDSIDDIHSLSFERFRIDRRRRSIIDDHVNILFNWLDIAIDDDDSESSLYRSLIIRDSSLEWLIREVRWFVREVNFESLFEIIKSEILNECAWCREALAHKLDFFSWLLDRVLNVCRRVCRRVLLF